MHFLKIFCGKIIHLIKQVFLSKSFAPVTCSLILKRELKEYLRVHWFLMLDFVLLCPFGNTVSFLILLCLAIQDGAGIVRHGH